MYRVGHIVSIIICIVHEQMNKYVVICSDDILMYSKSVEDCKRDLWRVLNERQEQSS